MSQSTESKNKALVLEASDTLLNKRDDAAPKRFWSNGAPVPVKVVVVYHSGYGHTVKIAEAVARGADAIIMGAPTSREENASTPMAMRTDE
jgi:hypothetical protein